MTIGRMQQQPPARTTGKKKRGLLLLMALLLFPARLNITYIALYACLPFSSAVATVAVYSRCNHIIAS
jgi:hypothetical protein